MTDKSVKKMKKINKMTKKSVKVPQNSNPKSISPPKKKRLLDDSSDEESDVPVKKSKVFGGFSELAVNDGVVSSSSEEEDGMLQGDVEKQKKFSKKEKKRQKKVEEDLLREAENSRLAKKTGPETEQEYKELIQCDRTCSAAWIQYICYLLSIGEVDRAHTVARESLSKIPSEEQKERINLWTTLLRIEVKFGEGKWNAENTLREACGNCDDYTLNRNIIEIYEENGLYKKVEDLHTKTMTKKYSQKTEVWLAAGSFYYKNKRLDEARAVLKKSLIVLRKKLAPEVTSKFATMEYELGEREEACRMYDSLLQNFPKRLDLWHVYANLLIKNGDYDRARQTFDRMLSLEFNDRRRLKIGERYTAFEAKHGTPATRKAQLEKLQSIRNELLKNVEEQTL